MYKYFNEIYHFISKFKESDLIRLKSNTSLIYRNYEKKIDVLMIKKIQAFCSKTKRKLYLSNNFKLAYNLGLDGAYIPSFDDSLSYNFYKKKKGFKIIGSAHNIREINIKQKQNVECIFISPLFKTNKCNDSLGLYRFINLRKLTNKKIVPLGGINKTNIKLLKMLNCKTFAAISFYKKKILNYGS